MSPAADESSDLRRRLMNGEEDALGRLFSQHRERLWLMALKGMSGTAKQ